MHNVSRALFLSTILTTTACVDKFTDTAEVKTWQSADLMPLSSGECPDMSISGAFSSFLSSGESRNVTVVFPANQTEGMRIVFFFHGLMDVNSDPTQYTARVLALQDLADQYNAVVVLPESPIWEMFGQQFFLWNIEDGTYQKDLALYDDLRTCVANNFTVDLDKLVTVGFSGGSLFSTILLGQRPNDLAAVVEMSGGADLQVATFENTFAPYKTPSNDIPVLLISGGENDVWPDASFTIVDFDSATDTLQSRLRQDNQFVVRCRHTMGHSITGKAFLASVDWLTNHTYKEPSPYLNDIGSWTDWCEIAP